MDKIKKNAGLKCAAAIILSVSLVALAISSLLGLYCFDMDLFEQSGRDALYAEYVERIARSYYYDAEDYYKNVVRMTVEGADETEIEQATGHYREQFSEDNCNYAFSITPVDEKNEEEYPSLSNYSCDDYQYSDSQRVSIIVDENVETFTYPISVWYIYMSVSKTGDGVYPDKALTADSYDEAGAYKDEAELTTEAYNDEFTTEAYDEYPDGGDWYYAYEYNTDIWITNDEISYNLAEDAGYQKAWNEFCEKYKDADFYTNSVLYDADEGMFYQEVCVSRSVEAEVQQYVKSEFTAADNFYHSLMLRYMDVMIDLAVPVFVISLLFVILCGIYLAASAGHRKGAEEISLNAFDRIPLDIICAALVIDCIGVIYMADTCFDYYSTNTLVIGVLGCMVFPVLIPAALMTIATRIKVSGWRLFRNTVIWKACLLAWRLVKLVWSKCVSAVKYLLRHMNLYWKYVGVLLILGLIALCALSTGSIGLTAIVGAVELICLCLLVIRAVVDMNMLKKGAEELASGNTDYEIDTSHMMWEFRKHGENLNRIKDGIQVAVEERMKSERMKTELITNVSHDIKTPLTSIISYVDLLKKEKLDNQTALEYVEVLDRQSARLKKLIQDLIDASKASTGNLTVHMEETDIRVLLEQAMGEFAEKMEKRGLRTVITYNTDPVIVMADGQHLWRIFQNIINNIAKYAQDNTRVYIDVDGELARQDEGGVVKRSNLIKVTFKNISREELNMSGDELMERFVRGDSSRNTEGSGLGLSIARSLAELQCGNLEIIVDGDLFKVVLLLVRA